MRRQKISTFASVGVMPNVETALYHDEAKLRRDLVSRGIECPELSGAPAQTFPETLDGGTVHFVLLRPSDQPLWAQLALLAHEATHIAERYFEELGEDEPASEERAYVVQSASGCLFDAHLRWREKHGDRP